MLNALRNIIKILKYYNRQNIFFLVLLMIMVSILELIGISLVIPFVTTLIEPNLNDGYIYLIIKNYLSNFNYKSFSIILIIFILIFYLLKNLFIIYVVMKQTRYSMNLITLIRDDFFKRYLKENYVEFIKKDQAELISNIMNVSADFGSTFMFNLLIFISEFLIILSLIFLLLFFNFKLSLVLIVVFSVILFFYFKYISPKLKKAGGQRIQSDNKVIDYSKLSFQNIKEVKIFGKEEYFLKIFHENALISEDSNFFYIVSAQYPRLGMEFFAVLCITLLTILMNYLGFSNTVVLTTLAFFGIAIFRILPSANKLMFAFQAIRFSKNTLDIILNELSKNKDNKIVKTNQISNLNFNKEIQIQNISYGYSNNLVLKNLNFNIKKGEFIGIKGESGSGKSTLIDILLGLISPKTGNILVDGSDIFQNISQWQLKCGYVSQNIFFINDTIEANVAFGDYKEDINRNNVWDSLKKADLYEFVEKLKKKEKTLIGENGLAISGGQRQRLAIARALYRDPEIIFFDEATSALDKKTEKNVLESIGKLKGKVTLLLVSHNNDIFQNCDKIIEI